MMRKASGDWSIRQSWTPIWRAGWDGRLGDHHLLGRDTKLPGFCTPLHELTRALLWGLRFRMPTGLTSGLRWAKSYERSSWSSRKYRQSYWYDKVSSASYRINPFPPRFLSKICTHLNVLISGEEHRKWFGLWYAGGCIEVAVGELPTFWLVCILKCAAAISRTIYFQLLCVNAVTMVVAMLCHPQCFSVTYI